MTDIKKQQSRILIIDDIPDNIKVVGTILYEKGYEITIAGSGEEALTLIADDPPDLILLDVMMPYMDGYETCRRIKGDPHTRDIPVIFMSARSETVDVLEGFQVGGVDYITKPIEQEILLARVNTHLTMVNLRRELERELSKRTGDLEQSEKRFQEMVETSSDWIWEVDENGYYTYSSPRCLELYGYAPEEMIGKKFTDFVAPEEFERLDRFFQELLIDKSAFYGVENISMRRDGRRINVESSARPIFDKSNIFIGYRGMDRDITKRKAAEKELTRTKAFLQNVIESMPSALITMNGDSIITMMNLSASLLTGLSNDEAIGRSLKDVLPHLVRYEDELEEVKRSKNSLNFHFEQFEEFKGSYFDISFYPLITQGMEGIVIRIDDVTEQEKIESQLVQSQKMETLGILAGGLAHDFNNVLAGIVTTVSLIEYDMEQFNLENENFREYIETISSSGKRAADIVKQLLALSRKNKLNFSTIDLCIPLRNVIKICRNSFDKSVSINSNCRESAAQVKADLTQIEQIILNLAINSYHAMTIMRTPGADQGGTLTISLDEFYADQSFCKNHLEAENRNYYTIKVTDTGVGIDRETQKKIFEPFFTTKLHEKGTGLGLSMVYNLVRQHSGFITVYSEEGVGTTFTVYIPSYKREIEEENKTSIKALETLSTDGKVLIIDDEKTVRMLASTILNKVGYSTILAENGREGLKIYQERKDEIELILLDISMPEMSGKETYIEIKKLDPEARVIICSGFEQDQRIQDLKKLGVDGYIQKPYNFYGLVKIINDVRKRRR